MIPTRHTNEQDAPRHTNEHVSPDDMHYSPEAGAAQDAAFANWNRSIGNGADK